MDANRHFLRLAVHPSRGALNQPIPSSEKNYSDAVARVLDQFGAIPVNGIHLPQLRFDSVKLAAVSDALQDATARGINEALRHANHLLKTTMAVVGRCEGDAFLLEYFDSQEFDVLPGHLIPASDTFAGVTIAADEIVSHHNLGESPLAGHRAHVEHRLKAYIGIPLRVGGILYGTLSFSDYVPREVPFSEAEHITVRLIASWLENALALKQVNQQLAESLAQQKRMARALERSNTNLAKFTQIASAELKEPLRTVTGFAQMVATSAKERLEPPERRYLDFVVEASTELAGMVDGLLLMARIDMVTDLVPVEPTVLCDRLKRMWRDPLEDAGGTLKCVGQLPVVRGDVAQLQLLFEHLVGNAIKFRRPDVPLSITVSASPSKQSGFTEYSVSDNGRGIAGRWLPHVCELFNRGDAAESEEGKGVGLALATRVVEHHGGKLQVDSQLDFGTTVKFTLLTA